MEIAQKVMGEVEVAASEFAEEEQEAAEHGQYAEELQEQPAAMKAHAAETGKTAEQAPGALQKMKEQLAQQKQANFTLALREKPAREAHKQVANRTVPGTMT